MVKEGSIGWFDGAATTSGNCFGARGILKISEHRIINWLINCGSGTNTRVELMEAWALLTLASRFSISKLTIMGDSKIVIDWLREKGSLQMLDLECWKERLFELIIFFQNISFDHIYREDNTEADMLSKLAMLKFSGTIEYFQVEGGHAGPHMFIELY
jgi:ribonuclease HI